MSPPKHSGSSGKVVLKYNDDDMGREPFCYCHQWFVEVSDGWIKFIRHLWLSAIKKGMDNTPNGPTGSSPKGLEIQRTLSIRNVLKDLMEWDDWGDAAESNYMG